MAQSKSNSGAKPRTVLEPQSRSEMPLVRTNFILMAIAGAVIIIGFLLMAGSSSTTSAFDPGIFSVRRIVVGPTLAFLGFIFMGVAIMWRAKPSGGKDK